MLSSTVDSTWFNVTLLLAFYEITNTLKKVSSGMLYDHGLRLDILE
jgi:hypothetical protein